MKRILPHLILLFAIVNWTAAYGGNGPTYRNLVYGAGVDPGLAGATVTAVTPTTATLSVQVTPDGTDANVWLNYTTDPTFTTGIITVPYASNPVSGTGGVTIINLTATGLQPHTTYYYAVTAQDVGGTDMPITPVQPFTTAPEVIQVFGPGANTYVAGQNLTFVVYYNDVAGMQVNTSGGTPYIALQIGNKARQATYFGIDPNPGAIDFNYVVQPGDYAPAGISIGNHIVTNGGIITDVNGYSADTVLNNPPSVSNVLVIAPAPPLVTAAPTTSVTDSAATLNTFVDDSAGNTSITISYGTTTTSLTTTVSDVTPSTIAAGTGNTAVSAALTGLLPSTTYYYQVVASNSAGTTDGSILSFTTAPNIQSVFVPTPGTYGLGTVMRFQVNFSGAQVNVSTTNGTPYIIVYIDNQATKAYFYSVNPTAPIEVNFLDTVKAGEYAPGGVTLGPVVYLNGGTITDNLGQNADTVIHAVSNPTQVVVDALPPVVDSIDYTTPPGQNVSDPTTLTFVVGFNKSVQGVTTSSFAIGGSGVAATLQSITQVNDSLYQVTVGGISGTGTLTLTVSATGTGITDLFGLPLAMAFTTGEAYNVTSVPQVITSPGTTSWTQADNVTSTPVAIDPALTLTDPGISNIQSATVTITNYVSGEDELSFTPQGTPIVSSFNSATGVMTFTGPATLATYQALLESVTYNNSSTGNPNLTPRVIAFAISDGSQTSAPATKTVTLTATDQTPIVTASPAVTNYTEGTLPVTIASGLTVSQGDANPLVSATVSISSGFASGDILNFVNQNGITGTYDAGTGILTLSGSSSIANYQTALTSITFSTAPTDPAGTRTISYVVNDGTQNSATATNQVDVAAPAPPVVVTSPVADTYEAGASPIIIDNVLTVSDVVFTSLTGATVSISSGFASGDMLNFTNQNGITGSYNASTGVLTLTGSSSIADYQAALGSITFSTPGSTTIGARTISFVVSDVAQSSAAATSQVNVVQSLAFTGGTAQTLQLCENTINQDIDNLLTTTDVVSGDALTYTVITGPANGALSAFPVGAISTGSTTTPSGITYTPNNGFFGSDQFTIQVSNGISTAQTTIAVTVNQLPTVSAITGAASICAGGSVQLSDATPVGTWTTLNPTIASVSGSGLVNGASTGLADIQYSVTVPGTGCSDTAGVLVSVNPTPATPSSITGSSSVSNEQTGVTYSVTNDPSVSSYAWSYTGTGATINGSGNTVTVDFSATATSGTLSVVAVSACGVQSAPSTFSITVGSPTIAISPVLAGGTVGVAYSQSLSASGGAGSYTYSETGPLPSGITLSTAGLLSGTPTEGGGFNITVTATDGGGFTGTQSYSFTIQGATIGILPTLLPVATGTVAYSQQLTASGGTSPYTWAVSTGSLPGGLSLDPNSGILAGTPTSSGSFNFTVTATDASTGTGPYKGLQAYSLTVNPPGISLTSTLPDGTVGVLYNTLISASGGATPYTFALAAGSTLPTGMQLQSDGDLTGTPTAGGTFSFSVIATDNDGFTGTQAYNLVITTPSLSISPATLPNGQYAQVYTAVSLSTSGGTAPYTYSTSGTLPPGMTVSSSGTLSGTPTQAGDFTFIVTSTDASGGSGPYNASTTYTLHVAQATLTVTANSQTITYGQAIPALTVTYSGFVNGDNASSLTTPPTVNTTAVPGSPAGTYPIVPSGAVDANYSITYVNGTLTINQATLTITADNQSALYGQPIPTLTVSYSGFVNGDNASTLTTPPAVSTTASQGSPIGTYPITVTSATDPNYVIVFVPGTLTIGQAVLTITANSLSKTYGDPNPTLTVSYSGFVGTDNASSLTTAPTVTTTATTGSGVGTYPITVSGAQDGNYIIQYVDGTLTVNPASLLVTATDLSRQYGVQNPPLTYTYSGFVNGDDASVVTTDPTISTTATVSSDPGQYPINLSGGAAANYTFLYQDGVLTITQSTSNVITFNALPVKTYGDPDFTITATASSGDPVTFTSADPSIATVTQNSSGDWVVHIVSAGQVVITASSAGTTDFAAAPDVPQTLTINKADQTITFPALPSSFSLTGGTVALEATASSGLPVVYTVSDPSLATITNNELTFTGTGTITVTATQPGNVDYNAATPVSYTIQIFNGSAFGASHIGVFPNPAHGTVHIRFSQDYLLTKYVLFSANGQIVLGMDGINGTGTNDIQLNINNLSPGVYFLRVVAVYNGQLVAPVFKVLIQ